MNSLPLLSSPFAHAIGWALLHLLWQGVIVAGVLAATLKLLAKQSSNTRYAVSCSALALLLVLGVATAYRAYDPVPPQPVSANEQAAKPIAITDVPKILFAAEATETVKSQAASLARSAQSTLPWIVLAWLSGVVLLSSRLMIGWMQTRRIARRDAKPATAEWQRIARHLAEALQLRRAVTLLESKAVEVPSVIGWLRPVVLLPASTLTGLTPAQIEMVLAHELAHIRRHDFFVNLLQAFVETLMFYHPAVWWISAQVRIERENCCDDLAVAVCGNPIQYARALTRLEELRATAPAIAVAANGGSLLDRIRRIATSSNEGTASTSRWAAAIALLAIIGIALVVPAIPALAQRDEAKKAPEAARGKMDVVVRNGDATAIANIDDMDVDADVDADLDALDADIDADSAGFDFDFDMPDAPDAPEAPEAPETPDLADFDFDFDFDAAGASPPAPPTPGVAPVPPSPAAAPVPMIAFRRDHDDEDDEDDERDRERERDDERERSREGRRADGSFSVDDLVRLRATGVTPAYVDQMRALYPNATLSEIAGASSLGITGEYITSLRNAGIPVDSLRMAKKLKAVDVNPEYIRSVRAIDPTATLDEITSARAVGVTPEYLQNLRAAGIDIGDLREATRYKAVGVTAEYAREMRKLYPDATAGDLAGARSVGLSPEYVESLRREGLEVRSLREVTRMRAVGVNGEYIREMRAAGVKIGSADDAVKLRATGVRADFVRRLAAAGYDNLSVRELSRLAAVGVDEDFIRDLQKYRTDKKN